MPTYVYECAACKREVEFFQSMSEAPKRKCPSCGKSKLVRRIGAGAGILFKGSGFYQTDYRSDSYKQGESADKPAAACTGEPKSCATSGGPCANGNESASKPADAGVAKKTKKKQ
jgi:putative FmdB family regulatory protein